jgi:hypothetical protein
MLAHGQVHDPLRFLAAFLEVGLLLLLDNKGISSPIGGIGEDKLES